jgi:hypothetical protein
MNKTELIKNCIKLDIFVAAGKLICAVQYCTKMQIPSYGFPNCLTNNMAKGYKDKLAGTAIHFYVNSASDNS